MLLYSMPRKKKYNLDEEIERLEIRVEALEDQVERLESSYGGRSQVPPGSSSNILPLMIILLIILLIILSSEKVQTSHSNSLIKWIKSSPVYLDQIGTFLVANILLDLIRHAAGGNLAVTFLLLTLCIALIHIGAYIRHFLGI